MRQKAANYALIYIKSFYPSLVTISPLLINPKITTSISTTNYSPPSSGNYRSLFVKPAKRGKQRAGGEALFPLHYYTFNSQQRHTHNYFISQLRWYCTIILKNEFYNINVLTTQLGTSCSFDSPGLARNEPTPGKRSQGDSTP